MGKYQGYEKYKASGVEWLGEIPEHWKRSVFRYYFDIQLGKMLQNEPQSENDEEISYLKAIHVRWDKVDTDNLPKMWASPRDKKKYQVKNGDLLISEGGEVGRTALLKELQEDSIIQNALHRVRPLSQSSVEYLNYLMRHIADTGWFDILCNKSTIAHLTSEKLGALALPLPPLDEQEKIARFLDHKTKQIDELIAKKESLIEKLDEKRTALISHAVTKGLEPNVPMKDSGIEWLGEIPEHWEVKRVKFLIQNLQQGSSPLASNIPAQPDELGVLKLSAISRGNFIRHENKALKQTDNLINSLSLKHGDVLLTRGNTPKLVGDACVVPQDEPNLLISDLIYRIRVKAPVILPSFLGKFLITPQARSEIEADARGSSGSMVKVSQRHILDWLITVPPKSEQQKIIDYLNQKTSEIDQPKAKIQKAIELLKEYRTALITNAVTGKIDVRQVPIP
ncbi:hypothetical protein CLI64_05950 [Nostoc sp. CENA543]|uniref:restriction endonuclease subunit S n=1 Tax=Nostoc sp. CENA543 TaxID=1869241 RepID=UPI000CA09508|nr:restriction endonuclease subunit S [Nostoc sp. CENA543]AUS99966.1 hypothetical protein CLI64_05950 [Nostoc sp. CENA543]